MSAQLMMVKYANIEVIAYSNSLHSLEYHGCKRLHFTSAGDDPAIVNSVFFFSVSHGTKQFKESQTDVGHCLYIMHIPLGSIAQ